MPSYLVETFLAGSDPGALAASETRARSAADELTRAGEHVRFDGAIHIPGDEICFYMFDAPTGETAVLAATRAELHPLRVVEAISAGRLTSRHEVEMNANKEGS